MLGDRLERWRLAGYLATETARRLQIDVVQNNTRVTRVEKLQLKRRRNYIFTFHCEYKAKAEGTIQELQLLMLLQCKRKVAKVVRPKKVEKSLRRMSGCTR